MNLNNRLEWLQDKGCKPCLSLRGGVWRAHVNSAGNYWEEGNTPSQAMEAAVKIWELKGMPTEG